MFQDTGLLGGKREWTKLPGVGRRITEFLGFEARRLEISRADEGFDLFHGG